MEVATVHENIRAVSAEFAMQRRERQQRRELVAVDFARLGDAGFLLTGVPFEYGGVWQSVRQSARPICEMLRTLAHGDSAPADDHRRFRDDNRQSARHGKQRHPA